MQILIVLSQWPWNFLIVLGILLILAILVWLVAYGKKEIPPIVFLLVVVGVVLAALYLIDGDFSGAIITLFL